MMPTDLILTYVRTLKLNEGDTVGGEELGRSVDISGTYVVGGANVQAFVWFVTSTSASYDELDVSSGESANLQDFGFSVAIWSNWPSSIRW